MRFDRAASWVCGIVCLLSLGGLLAPFACAEGCRTVYQPSAATPPLLATPGVQVVTSPFEPLDVFVFIGQPSTPAPALAAPPPAPPPAGGAAAEELHGLPVAVGYLGRPRPPAGGPDVKAVAEALGSCSACHTAPGKGGVSIFAASGAFDPKVSPAAIAASVKDDRMPLRGPKLSAAQKQLIEAWAAQSQQKGS